MDTPPRALILGGHGQVGASLLLQALPGSAVALGRGEVDVTDRESVHVALAERRPDVVINAAVFHPVDLCESEVSRAFEVNALAPAWLAAACRRQGIRLIHISTDYVFGGAQRTPFSEYDCPAPANVYARSKLAGEHVVLATDSRHCVVRTSSVYGRSSSGSGVPPFAVRMMDRARTGKATRVVVDQVVSPTHADDLAKALWQLDASGEAGLFHMAGGTPASWYEVARQVFDFAGRPDLLAATTTAEFGAAAKRSPYTALRSVRLGSIGIGPLRGVEKALPEYLQKRYPEIAERRT